MFRKSTTLRHNLRIVFVVLSMTITASAAPVCTSIFTSESDVSAFVAWKPENPSSVTNLKVEQFFPADFLTELKANNIPLTLKVTKVGKAYQFRFNTDKTTMAEFDIWNGSQPGQIVLEHLFAENPMQPKGHAKLGLDQLKKGLPSPVFTHVRDQIFEFFKAGGYREIEIRSSQNIAVYFLYNKVVGGEPITERAQLMNTYLRNIIRMRTLIWGQEVKSTNDIAIQIEEASPGKETQELWKSLQNDTAKLTAHGFELIKDATNTVVAFKRTITNPDAKRSKEIGLVIPFLPDRPVLSNWDLLHDKICPECMIMIKKL